MSVSETLPVAPALPTCDFCEANLRRIRQLHMSIADTTQSLQQERKRERERDLDTWQENLARLLSEKARLLEEVETMQGQKDGITEALVRAHQQLREHNRLAEERDAFKVQYSEASVQLLHRTSELQLTQQELRVSKAATAAAAAASMECQQYLATARATLATSSAAQSKLRAEVERAQGERSAAEDARARSDAFCRTAEASVARARAEGCTLSALLAEDDAARQEAIEREAMAIADARVWRSSVLFCEDELRSQSQGLLRRVEREAQAAADSARRAELSEAAAAQSERGRLEACDEVVRLRSERDAMAAELAAARKLAESLKSELRKAMVQRQGHV